MSPAAARRRSLRPDPEEAEEYEMERDGSPGRQLTLNGERQRHRERGRETDRQTDRDREIETETESCSSAHSER